MIFGAHQVSINYYCCDEYLSGMFANIAKGTTDPRDEFISQVLTHILIKFRISSKHLLLNIKLKLRILTKLRLRILTTIQLRNLNHTSAKY